MSKEPPSLAELSAVMSYDPTSGIIRWVVSRQRVGPGRMAGTVNKLGYVSIKFAGHRLYAHRVAWLFSTGKWPVLDIDHINHNPSDNRISNLRQCTRAQNHVNSSVVIRAESGYRGVVHGSVNSWQASIGVDYKIVSLGSFDDPRLAAAAYDRAALAYFGEFARLNFPNQAKSQRV